VEGPTGGICACAGARERHEHPRFFSEHFVKKGVEVAQACKAAVAGLRELRSMRE
jgi:hypothetical protein